MKDTVWIYPGSFDPITFGHINIIERAAGQCGKLIVALLHNGEKSSLFSVDERVKMIEQVAKGFNNVEVMSYEGLQVDLYKMVGASAAVRGIRNPSDYEYELMLSRTNDALLPGFETIFLVTDVKYSFVSSSFVRQIASFGGDLSSFVPPYIEAEVREKYKENYL